MDLHQLKTFVTVAREGSVTRASAILHLSQPAVSAHIKAMEEALGLTLFVRTARGMAVTPDGERLLAKARETLAAHEALLAEASRTRGALRGKLRVGAGLSAGHEALGRLVAELSAKSPEVEVALVHKSSDEVLAGLRDGSLDAGFYSEPGEPEADLITTEAARFSIFVVSAPGRFARAPVLDWAALGEASWIYPTERACCSRTAERLFVEKRVRPRRVIGADRQELTRTLVASGLGVGLLHEEAAREAERRGEIELLHEAEQRVRVLFAHLTVRTDDPLLRAASSIVAAPRRG